MKKLILMVASVFLLSGCDDVKNLVAEISGVAELEAKLDRIAPSHGILDPTSTNLTIVGNRGTFFAISIDDVKAYAKGTSLKLTVINLSGVTITGVKVKVDPTPIREKRKSSSSIVSDTTVKISKIESGGSRIEAATISELKPDEIDYITVSIESEGIEYHKPPR